jgi:hypothetical protein
MPRRHSGSAAVLTYLGLTEEQLHTHLQRLVRRRPQEREQDRGSGAVSVEFPALPAVLPDHRGASTRPYGLSLRGPKVSGSGLTDGTRVRFA